MHQLAIADNDIAGVADEWELPSLRRSFLLGHDDRRRELLEGLI